MKKEATLFVIGMIVFLTTTYIVFYNLGSNIAADNTKTIDTGFVAMAPGVYDSADTAIVLSRDTEKMLIRFQNLETGKQYTLQYDGTTTAKDKYDQEIAISQVPDGSIVENRFFKSKKALSYIKISPEAFFFDGVKNYTFSPQENQMLIGSSPYSLNGNLCMLSEGKQIDPVDLSRCDVVRISGIGNSIYCILVEKGHGYLRLKNDEFFRGGWIEVGQAVFREIEEDMLLVVPEGSYQVRVTNEGNEANQTISFNRNEEMVWDLRTVQIVQVEKGSLIFTVHPMNAKVTIDGQEVDTSNPYEVEYGVHQLIATADGYDTITQFIKVNDTYANLDINLVETEKEEDKDTKTKDTSNAKKDTTTSTASITKSNVSDTQTSSTTSNSSNNTKTNTDTNTNTTSKSNTGNSRVYIDSPKDVEVYIDGNYVGVAPVDFKKEVGSYVVTLRKSGYQTRSYTIALEDDDQDVNFSFSDLGKLDE